MIVKKSFKLLVILIFIATSCNVDINEKVDKIVDRKSLMHDLADVGKVA